MKIEGTHISKIHNRKRRDKRNTHIIKSLIIAGLVLSIIEGSLYCLEVDKSLFEPYEWGDRLDIPYKINDCIKLFSLPENELLW